MEKLYGLDGNVVNLEQLIHLTSEALVVVPDFSTMFRTLLFQSIYTLAMCTYAFNGLFRHNDLHLRNICFTPWNDAQMSVDATYTLPCFPDDATQAFVNRHFRISSTYRAVMIDYGWSALLPGLGPDKDSRFYSMSDSGVMVDTLASELCYRDCGMSQTVPCQQYDLALLLFSIYTACTKAMKKSSVPPKVRDEFQAFVSMYQSLYEYVPLQVGRMSLDLQKHLLRSKCLPDSSIVVPTPEIVLCSSYFFQFRCASTARAAHAFGLRPSSSASSDEPVEVDEVSFLAGKGKWSKGVPPTGRFSGLLREVNKNITSWQEVPKRELSAQEESQWLKKPVADSVKSTRVLIDYSRLVSPIPLIEPLYVYVKSPTCGYTK